MDILIPVVAIIVITVAVLVGLVTRGSAGKESPESHADVDYPPRVNDDEEAAHDAERRPVSTLEPSPPEPPSAASAPPEGPQGPEPAPEPAPEVSAPRTPVELPVEMPEPTAGRLSRLRSRLARSSSTLGRGLFTLLSRDVLDEDTWEEVEDTLLQADIGVAATQQIVANLRTKVRVLGTRTPAELRPLLREELVAALGDYDRSLHTVALDARPSVTLVVGVNGTGKTTTCGKLARVLVADGRSVLLGAADTFRAAAADQLQTWGSRVGADVVRGPEGSDPASVAFESVRRGGDERVDVVVVDTAGRLHTKAGLMDELAKVKRVVEKQGEIDETLLVLDATTGQNGVVQAKVFTEAVEVTGIVLTKLDGTAKGGIVVSVQRELGIPVKLIGLGEGPDDLAPFEAEAFADALLGDEAAL